MTNPSEAEVNAAFQVGGKMLEAALTQGGKPIKVIEIFRAALTAAAQVRADAETRIRRDRMFDDCIARIEKQLVQAPTEPAEASCDHLDMDVQCKCGWRGKESELNWAATRSATYFCPRCHTKFSSWPQAATAQPKRGQLCTGSE